MTAVTETTQHLAGADSSPSRMTVSLIVCCYRMDRWEDLCAAVDSALLQQPAIEEVIVVVDYNDALRLRIAAAYEGVIVIDNQESRGLSGARNTGISRSKGDLIAFLDDDAVAHPEMIARLGQSVENGQVLGSVALIEPEWLGTPARWFPDEFLWVVGCTYKGMGIGRVRNLLGAAMCVRRSVFEQVGGFNSGLGRNHSALPLGCEETEFCIRANRAHPASHFVFEPAALCRHKVPTVRVSWRYFTHRCYAEGWSKAHVEYISQAPGSLASERAYATRTVPAGSLRAILEFLSTGDVRGLGRAAAGPWGLIAAAAGYVVARVTLIFNPTRASALRQLPTALTCDT
jgi:glucosyl-dolichyl phosphate glucuronosyltransferase